MKKNYTHITLLVDRSGSMDIIRDDSQGGINHFIRTHKEAPGQCTFSLYQFDNVFETVYSPRNISLVEGYTLVPRNSTALLDSQMKAIQLTGDYLRELPEEQRPEKVIFLTVTDGQENASTEFAGKSHLVKAKVKEQESKYNWEFIYIGANQDAFAVGQSLGITRTTTYAGTGISTAAMYANVASSTLNSRATGADSSALLASTVTSDGHLVFDNKNEEDNTNGDNK